MNRLACSYFADNPCLYIGTVDTLGQIPDNLFGDIFGPPLPHFFRMGVLGVIPRTGDDRDPGFQ